MKFFDSLKTGFVVWVWNHTPHCAEMARLASRSLEGRLSLPLRLKMWLHYLICAWCKRYFHQVTFLHQSAPGFDEQASTMPGRELAAEARQRMLQRLEAAGEEKP